jgi:hypothetical protein
MAAGARAARPRPLVPASPKGAPRFTAKSLTSQLRLTLAPVYLLRFFLEASQPILRAASVFFARNSGSF